MHRANAPIENIDRMSCFTAAITSAHQSGKWHVQYLFALKVISEGARPTASVPQLADHERNNRAHGKFPVIKQKKTAEYTLAQ